MIGWTMNADPLVCTRLEDNFSMNTSKIICDICGTVYPDTAAACPICGFPQKENAGVTDSVSVGAESTAVPAAAAASRNKGGRFSNKNVKKRNQSEADEAQRPVREKAEKPRKTPRQEAPEIEQEPEEKSNRGLVIIAIILAIAVLLVGGYIISRFIGGRDAYDNPNAPVIGTNPSTETTAPVETEPVETGVPCVGMTVSDASVEFLGINRSWKLSIAATPADTTDELTFTSSDENVVTVTPDGRLTSVGPGTAVITITCGDVVKECQVVCDFEIETEPVETTEPEETEETTEPSETTEPTEPQPELPTAFRLNSMTQMEVDGWPALYCDYTLTYDSYTAHSYRFEVVVNYNNYVFTFTDTTDTNVWLDEYEECVPEIDLILDTEGIELDYSSLLRYNIPGGLSIYAENGMEHHKAEGFTGCLGNRSVIILFMADNKEANNLTDMDLEGYADLLCQTNELSHFKWDTYGSLCTSFYSTDETGMEYYNMITVKETTDSFWVVQMACSAENQAQYARAFSLWASSVSE